MIINDQVLEDLFDLKEHYKELNSQHKKLKEEIKAIHCSRLWRFLQKIRSFLRFQ